jgi:hypothetical protein
VTEQEYGGRKVRLECADGTLYARIMQNGDPIEVVVVGDCPCCQKVPLDIPSELWRIPVAFGAGGWDTLNGPCP